MLLLGWDGLLQLCLCLCQLLFGLCQRLLHVPHQRFCVVNRMHSNALAGAVDSINNAAQR